MSDKYQLIAAELADQDSQPVADPDQWPVSVQSMCQVLGVSRSGFYQWRCAPPSTRGQRRAVIMVHVQAAFEAGRGTYGARRVHAVLTRSADHRVASAGLDLVRDIMAELGLVACQPRSYRRTTMPGADVVGVADHVQGDFTADAPGRRLVGDITYVRTWAGWVYLATVIDCCTKAVIGWSMADHMRTDLICDAITMAAARTEMAEDVVFHSDRGSQYTSAQFATHLRRYKITGSMGRTGTCWDNALAESFFAALKNELVYRVVFPTRAAARSAIAEYIEVFYNRQRLHSGLGYRTPVEVAHQYRNNPSIAA